MTDLLDAPPSFDPEPEIESDYFCQEIGCGKPLYYSGRGRPPTKCAEHKKGGTTSSRVPKASSDVEQAVASLHSMYIMTLFPMTFMAPQTAEQFSAKIDTLDDRNREILRGNAKLAKQIASASNELGLPALIIANLSVLGPTALSAYGEYNYRRGLAREAALKAAAGEE